MRLPSRSFRIPISSRPARSTRASRFASGAGRRRRDDVEGTRTAVRTAIRYRNGVLEGKGASLSTGTWRILQPIEFTG